MTARHAASNPDPAETHSLPQNRVTESQKKIAPIAAPVATVVTESTSMGTK